MDNEEFLANPKTIISPHTAALTNECTVRVHARQLPVLSIPGGRMPRSIFNIKDLTAVMQLTVK